MKLKARIPEQDMLGESVSKNSPRTDIYEPTYWKVQTSYPWPGNVTCHHNPTYQHGSVEMLRLKSFIKHLKRKKKTHGTTLPSYKERECFSSQGAKFIMNLNNWFVMTKTCLHILSTFIFICQDDLFYHHFLSLLHK